MSPIFVLEIFIIMGYNISLEFGLVPAHFSWRLEMFRKDPTIRTVQYGNSAYTLNYVVVKDLLSKGDYEHLTVADLIKYAGGKWMDAKHKPYNRSPKNGEVVHAVHGGILEWSIDEEARWYGPEYIQKLSDYVSEGNVFLCLLDKRRFGHIIANQIRMGVGPELQVSTFNYGFSCIALLVHCSKIRVEQGDIALKSESWAVLPGELAGDLRLIWKKVETEASMPVEVTAISKPVELTVKEVVAVNMPTETLPFEQSMVGDQDIIAGEIQAMLKNEKRIQPLLKIMTAAIEAMGLHDVPASQIIDAIRRQLTSEQEQVDLPLDKAVEGTPCPTKTYSAEEIVAEAMAQGETKDWFLVKGNWDESAAKAAYAKLKKGNRRRINFGFENGKAWMCGTTMSMFQAVQIAKELGAESPISETDDVLVVRAEKHNGTLTRVVRPSNAYLTIAA